MFILDNLLKIRGPVNILSRMYGKHNKKYLYKDGKIVNGLISYYPRDKDEKDPEIVPTKLFRVHRTKPVKGNPFWEKRILREFGLFGTPNVTVVKNIPENCARLWKIKHLIKITPIHFPNGEPTADDINHTYLKENGDCIVIKDVEYLNKRKEAAEKFEQDKKEFDGPTLRTDTRLKWVNNWEGP